MTERSLLQRARPAGLALWFVTLVAALAGAALATATPAGAALSPGCTDLTLPGPGLRLFQDTINTFEAGERLTFQAGPPTAPPGATPTLMGMAVRDPAGNLIVNRIPFPGTLVYDFPLTGVYTVVLFTEPATGTTSTWNVTCGPPSAARGGTQGVRHPACHPLLTNPCPEGRRHDGSCVRRRVQGMEGQPVARPCRFRACPLLRGGRARLSNLPGYTNSGRMTDGLGTDFGSLAPIVEGAVYPYFRKS